MLQKGSLPNRLAQGGRHEPILNCGGLSSSSASGGLWKGNSSVRESRTGENRGLALCIYGVRVCVIGGAGCHGPADHKNGRIYVGQPGMISSMVVLMLRVAVIASSFIPQALLRK